MFDAMQLEKILNGEMAISSAIAVKETDELVEIWENINDKILNGEGLHKIEGSILELIEKAFAYGKEVGYEKGHEIGYDKGYDEGIETTENNNDMGR